MSDKKTIAFACDHGGFILRAPVLAHLRDRGYVILDFGTDSGARCDYPDYGEPACRAVVAGEAELAVLI